jgi:hypothetical protein
MKREVNTHKAKTPVRGKKPKRKLGMLQGKLTVPADFDEPLPDEILDGFEGRPASGAKNNTCKTRALW